MSESVSLIRRSLIVSLSVLLLGVVGFIGTAHAQKPAATPSAARRPLAKPPSGSRGFEQLRGNDASNRLIAAGATRGDKANPNAPVEGLAYDSHPFFAWMLVNNTPSYHFVLYDGNVRENPSVPILYEKTVSTPELRYPKDAPALVPGKLYSWRVFTQSGGGKDTGEAATFFILSGPDAKEVTLALEKAKLTAPKTTAERLRQAQLFEEYGVWYDALRIARDLAKENPNDASVQAYYDSLLEKLDKKQDE